MLEPSYLGPDKRRGGADLARLVCAKQTQERDPPSPDSQVRGDPETVTGVVAQASRKGGLFSHPSVYRPRRAAQRRATRSRAAAAYQEGPAVCSSSCPEMAGPWAPFTPRRDGRRRVDRRHIFLKGRGKASPTGAVRRRFVVSRRRTARVNILQICICARARAPTGFEVIARRSVGQEDRTR